MGNQNVKNADNLAFDKLIDVLSGQFCPYCQCETELVSDKEIYGPNSMFGGLFYRCVNNYDHYVGCHEGTKCSLGRVADKKLRDLKRKCHEIFDPLWKNKPQVFSSRHKAYYWLSKQMGIADRNFGHFGMFNENQCEQAISIIENFKNSIED